jgi:hypothetical protein
MATVPTADLRARRLEVTRASIREHLAGDLTMCESVESLAENSISWVAAAA